MKETIDLEEGFGLQTITLKDMVLLLSNDKKRLDFLKTQIEVEGLKSYSLTVKAGLPLDRKLKAVRDEIDNWKPENRIPIKDL